MNLLQTIAHDLQETITGLLKVAQLEERGVVVIGCSTSEIAGKRIGSASSTDIARTVLSTLLPPLQAANLYLAVQCCEHLNRALVVERACAQERHLERVTVLPQPQAGGALAARAMEAFSQPVVVESIQAEAGLDIGDTFIGMHIRPVAVPVRLPQTSIGQAHLTLARSRPRLIGGKRAIYPE